ncbi:MAG: histidine phosphatase family protein [Pseudomonadota bacterium]
MPRIIAALIRHGDYYQLPDTPSAWQPFPLNEQGKNHALAAAANINNILNQQNWQLDATFNSSQLLRAWQTATIIGKKLNQLNPYYRPLKVIAYEQLAERGVGSVANLSISRIEEIIACDPRYENLPVNWKSNSYYCLPFQGAESLMDSGERVAKHIKTSMLELRNEIKTDTLKLYVGHGAAFRHAAFHLGLLDFEQIAQLSMFHGSPIYFELTEENKWTHIFGEWKVRGETTQFTD